MSSPGKDRPASRTRTRPSNSRQAMLRPTSPTPPRKTSLQGPGILQRLSDLLDLLVGGGDEREARRTHRLSEESECGLHRDGIRGDEHPVEHREKLLVDLASGRDIAACGQVDHLPDALPHHVRRYRDGSDRTDAHEPEYGPVVTRVHLEAGRGGGDQMGNGIEITRRVLHGDDVLHRGEAEERVVLDPDGGAPGDVV